MATISEISVRLSADNSNYRSVMDDSSKVAEATGKNILRRLDIRAGVTAIASAAGISITSIAEMLSRALTGMSAEVEQKFKTLADLSTRVAESTISRMHAQAKVETQYQLLLLERERILQRLESGKARGDASNNVGWLASLRAVPSILGVINPLFDKGAALTEEINLNTRESLETDKLRLDTIVQEIAKLDATKAAQAEIADLKKLSADEAARGAAATQIQQLSAEDQVELFRYLDKGVANLTTTERLRYDILKLQTQQMGVQAELEPLLKKGVENLTPEEKTRFKALLSQSDNLTTQINQKTDLIGQTKDQVKVEKEVTDQLEQQIKYKSQIQKVGKGEQDLSDRELQRALDNLHKGLNKTQAGTTDPYVRNMLSAPYKVEIAALTKELDLRQSIRRDVKFFGEDRAFDRYPGVSESRFADILRGSEENTQLLRSIDKKLGNGITVKSLN